MNNADTKDGGGNPKPSLVERMLHFYQRMFSICMRASNKGLLSEFDVKTLEEVRKFNTEIAEIDSSQILRPSEDQPERSKEEILAKHYKNYEKRIAYPENVFAAMQEYRNAGVKSDEWVVLDEQEPDENNEYNVYSEDYDIVSSMWWDGCAFCDRSEGENFVRTEFGDTVTHWKLFPAPPKQ